MHVTLEAAIEVVRRGGQEIVTCISYINNIHEGVPYDNKADELFTPIL